MELTLITNKIHLTPYQEQILSLFQRSFGKTLSAQLWQWAYLENPCGEPIVSLCIKDHQVVGHYAVIPFTLWQQGMPLKTVLSMTTMVDPTMQGQGLFIKQANHVYDYLAQQDYDYVFGFPNKNSLPGFLKHLKWTIATDTFVAKVDAKKIRDHASIFQSFHSPQYHQLNMKDPLFNAWRLSKPGHDYARIDGHVIKPYENNYDLVFLDPDFANSFHQENDYHMLVDESVSTLKENKLFDYPFGYRAFKAKEKPQFKLDLLLSDVY